MDNFLYFYQHIPYCLNPVAFSIGGFSVDWYSLMYLIGFGIVYFILRYKIKNYKLQITNKYQILNSKIKNQFFDTDILFNLLLWLFIGLLIGARLGYVLFYNLPYYTIHPLEIISPLDSSGAFVGVYGMSYHGGLVGALAAFFIFIKKYKLSFWKVSDFIIPAIPAGYFLGRLGNFLNGELWGRATTRPWGMFFPGDQFGFLRHPSQLYEALLESLALFIILWTIRDKPWAKNNLLAFYLVGYALARIVCEFFREPDLQIGYIFGWLTMGQILSFGMLLVGIFLWYNRKCFGATE